MAAIQCTEQSDVKYRMEDTNSVLSRMVAEYANEVTNSNCDGSV